jgi:type IX secretion system PorP/SprF family membrane protein
MVVNDSQGPGRLKSTEVSGIYSYQIQLGEENFLRLGAQGTYSNKSLDYFGLTFGDQYTNRGFTGNSSSDPFANKNNISPIKFVDYSGGALFYNSKTWLGVSMHHINRPTYTFLNTGAASPIAGCPTGDCLPRKLSISGGLKIPLANPYSNAANVDKEFSISPAFLYKRQGKFDQLDVGFYGTYSSLTAGLWYRGIPIKKKNITRTNHDAFVFLLGYRQDNFSIGYSYDITISSLGFSTGGSHEISIAYQLEPFERNSPRKSRNKKELSCPKY